MPVVARAVRRDFSFQLFTMLEEIEKEESKALLFLDKKMLMDACVSKVKENQLSRQEATEVLDSIFTRELPSVDSLIGGIIQKMLQGNAKGALGI